MTNQASLGAMFRPSSVAIIGASGDASRIGGRPVAGMIRAGFAGKLYPVNPRHAVVQGLKAYQSLASVPGPVDLAVVAVAAPQVAEAIAACIAKNVQAIVLYSSGFAEVDDAGREAQMQIAKQCREAGIRLLGPNTLGYFNVRDGIFLTFSTVLDFVWPREGGIGIASQSGAFGSYCYGLMAQRGLGFSHFVATGNEADVDVADAIDWMVDDPATKVIMAYLEGCRSGPALRAALEHAARAGKPVIIMKAGASEAGATAAASHTGSMAGTDAAFDAVFAATGTLRASSIQEFVDLAYAAAIGPLPAGNRVGIVSVSGGMGVLMADAASLHGLDLPAIPPTAAERIKAVVPFAAPANPMDVTGQIGNDWSIFPRILSVMLEECPFDAVLSFLQHLGRSPAIFAQLEPSLIELRRRYPNRVFILCMGCDDAVRDRLQADGFMIFDDPVAAMGVLAVLGRRRVVAAHRVTLTESPTRLSGIYDDAKARALLASVGIPFVSERVATTEAEAVRGAGELGFPVALKILSADIAHKSDIGGVALNLVSGEAVGLAWQRLMQAVATKRPDAVLTGAIVSPMLSGGVETVLGVKRDPVFGPMVVFGLGGILVEILRDVVVRPAPVDHATALEMIGAIKGFALLKGVRGALPADLDALADALVKLSVFAATHPDDLESAEINPFIALPNGGMAVDALVIPSPQM